MTSNDSSVRQLLDYTRRAPLLTLQEAAKLLSTSSANVRRLIERGMLPGVNVGASGRRRAAWRVRPEDLETFIKSSLSTVGRGLSAPAHLVSPEQRLLGSAGEPNEHRAKRGTHP